MNISVPSEWKVLVSLFTDKIVQMFSCVVSITVLSVSIIWCKLWQQFGSQSLYWNAEGCTSYVCHISVSKVQIYTLLYVGYWLKETVCLFKMFELMRISQYLAAPFSHCKPWLRTWSTILALISLICASVLGLFCLFLCFVSVHVHTSLLLFFLSAVDPDRFLNV